MPNFGEHISRHCVLEGACLHLLFGRLLLVVPFIPSPAKYPAQPCLYRLPHGQSEGWKRGPTLGKGTRERQSPAEPLDPWHLIARPVSDDQNTWEEIFCYALS